jgi:2-methylisocitrate lyase-like PEP mutase family enzyme
MDVSSQRAKADTFRSLHARGSILVLPNVWDVASARIFVKRGAKAVGTTSAGIASSFGYGDGEEISRDEMLAAVSRIAHAVNVPVTADIEGGYGTSPEAVADSTRAAIEAGAVGINIEDAARSRDSTVPPEPLLPASAHAERIAAARRAGEKPGIPLVINAVIDTYLQLPNSTRRFEDTVERARLYREAGADCVYVPGIRERDEIGALVELVGGPVNVLAMVGVPPVRELESLGVVRVSIGYAAARAVITLLQRIADELLSEGTYDTLLKGSLSNEAAEALITAL